MFNVQVSNHSLIYQIKTQIVFLTLIHITCGLIFNALITALTKYQIEPQIVFLALSHRPCGFMFNA